jgi:23S rRNA pseudouridine1911/1915/1917 synthase
MPLAEPVPLDVLDQDADLLALNKPAGIVVHPTYRNVSGTLLNGILWHLRDRPDVRPGLVSRLDKDTSGIVLVALSPGAHARIQRDAHAGLVTKLYIALVRGTPTPSSGVIRLPLRRDPADRRRVIVHETGVACETRYTVVSSNGEESVVECELVTGRTHQIRVHLAASGWPILGDSVYGSADPRIGRQALHAWRMSMPHPVSRELFHVEAPIPGDMKFLMAGT